MTYKQLREGLLEYFEKKTNSEIEKVKIDVNMDRPYPSSVWIRAYGKCPGTVEGPTTKSESTYAWILSPQSKMFRNDIVSLLPSEFGAAFHLEWRHKPLYKFEYSSETNSIKFSVTVDYITRPRTGDEVLFYEERGARNGKF